MNSRTTMGIMLKYLPYVGFACMTAYFFYKKIISPNEDDSFVYVLRYGLLLLTEIALIGNLIVLDAITYSAIGKIQNFLNDIKDEDSKSFSESYNGLISLEFGSTCITILFILYVLTDMRLFLKICYIIMAIFAVTSIVGIITSYLESKSKDSSNIFSKMIELDFFPTIILIGLLMLTNNTTVRFVYENIYSPDNNASLIFSLLIVLCYIPAILFCYFLCIYNLLGLYFRNKDLAEIRFYLDYAKGKNYFLKKELKEATEYVDSQFEECDFKTECWLNVYYHYVHLKVYFLGKVNSAKYLTYVLYFNLAKKMSVILTYERTKTNIIRFVEIIVAVELLVLNMVLFIKLGGDNPCSRFFELISTVIIIPIILTSLGNLKKKTK